MENIALYSIVVIVVLGIFSQWLAWKIQWPSIVIMSIAGLLIGPVFGLVNPDQALDEFYSPIISLAVTIILFEGSSSLDIRELKGISKSVLRIVTIGAFLAWIGGSLAAHYIAGLGWEVSFIIGGLFVVTGPTVIIPLLRQAKLKPRVAAALKWEGIIVDPAGPLLALFAYEVVKVTSSNSGLKEMVPFFFWAIIAGVVGLAIGILVSIMIGRGLLPEYLKSPIIISFILIVFSAGEFLMHETGMLAVTVMGITLGRSKKYVSSIKSTTHFVENVSVLLTSTVFILLTASLPREVFEQILSWPIITFVLAMLFLVRPLSIWIATIGTELTNPEKTLISWIAPRGIVALTVSGYFANILLEDGYEEATILTAITFALVFITVCAHGFTITPFAKKLGLANTEPPGILIVGANEFSVAFASYCKEMGIPVLIADHTLEHLIKARQQGIKTFYGEILSEHTQFSIDLTSYQSILSMTDEAAYNALVCQSYVPTFGYHHTFALPVTSLDEDSKKGVPPSLKGNLLFGKSYEELHHKIRSGYTFKTIEMDDQDKSLVKQEEMQGEDSWLFIRKKDESLTFATLKQHLTLEEGDQLVVLTKK
ncbi:cation:proton antiporter [Paucisalibacillus globulus]|uniref:cation:proton antiporter n=1 Tax=Paucisalibacillus globulus TaxID=351095 RepID=UPI0003FE5CAF|nr:sodium:proton antiporter [Paucisalibacillus globulus]